MHPDLIDRRDLSSARKLREQQAAREMEKHYTKEQILEAYLNQINFGHGWYGVESAARHYFGKTRVAADARRGGDARRAAEDARRLRSDRAIPTRRKERRNLILGLMAEQGYITPHARGAHEARAA